MNYGVGTIARAGRAASVLTVLSLCLAPRVLASENEDFAYWMKAAALIPIGTDWRLNLEERLTFGDEARRLDDHQTDFCLYYSGLAENVRVGLGYKQTFEKDGDDWLAENRPLVNVIVKGTPFGLTVIDRSRFEYRMPEEGDDVWRYRNKLLVTLDSPLTATTILPYVAEEIFVEFDGQAFNEQRLYAGFYVPLHKQIRLELFYLWKLDEAGDTWHDSNVIGSYLYFLF
jgi:hypothetical protein